MHAFFDNHGAGQIQRFCTADCQIIDGAADCQFADIATWVKWGAGPRAGQALVLCAKARALIHGRLGATREDVVALAAPVLRHRLLLTFLAEAEGKSADEVVSLLLAAVPSPN